MQSAIRSVVPELSLKTWIVLSVVGTMVRFATVSVAAKLRFDVPGVEAPSGYAISWPSSVGPVTVTGTMMLRSLYDNDLPAFDYESVNLARQESIDHLVGTVNHIDVLVLAASCHLPYGLPPGEQAFIAGAARSGLLGPTFLTTRLRLKLGQSPALGGGCVVNTGAVTSWLQLSTTPEAAAPASEPLREIGGQILATTLPGGRAAFRGPPPVVARERRRGEEGRRRLGLAPPESPLRERRGGPGGLSLFY